MAISINQNDNQLISISNNTLQDININENNNQTIGINNITSQDIGINENTNQILYINGGGEVIGITDVMVNGVSVVSGNIAYVIVPTKLSELTNDTHFLTSETDPTVPSYVKAISLADITSWNNKQNALVSGSTIKTINNESLLGSGNINITGTQYSAGDGIDITNDVISNTITSYNDLEDLPTIPEKVSDLINDEDFVSESDLAEVSFTGSYGSLSDTPIIPEATSELTNDSGFITNSVNNLTNYMLTSDINTALGNKQDTLVSGTNIKTVNNNSLLGSGDITISGGTPTDVQINGTSIVSNNTANIITESAYNSSTNKIATKSDIPTLTSQLTNDSNFAKTDSPNNIFTGNMRIYGNLTVNGDTTVDGNSVIFNYSTAETKIGTWINGSDLYRKIIAVTLPNATQTSISTGLSNVNVVSLSGYTTNGVDVIPINFINSISPSTMTHCYYELGSLFVGCSFNGTSFSGYVTLEYTKN